MEATPYNNFVHFTPRSIFWILVLLAVLTAPIWWTALRAGTTKAKAAGKKPDLSGEWIGTAHMTSYGQGIGRTSSVDQQATFSLKLEMYDTFLERYRGEGELRIQDGTARKIEISGLSLGDWFKPEQVRAAAGALRLAGNLEGDLQKQGPGDDVTVIQGSASTGRIQFKTEVNEVGYGFEVDLHRNR